MQTIETERGRISDRFAPPARPWWGLDPRERVLCAVLVLALWGPFLNKPVHIDDTVVLEVAARVAINPLDPFAGSFDWVGENLPLWQTTTNPPLLSYYLAPFWVWFGASEVALHAAMLPFPFLLALSLLGLSRRFSVPGWWTLLFVLTSSPIWVATNLMRDVPAAALASVGLALFLRGVDQPSRPLLLAGSVAAGLAILTKYSMGMVVPLLALYAFLNRRSRLAAWLIPALAIPTLWCLFTWHQYGEAHPLYLAARNYPGPTFFWLDKAMGAMVITGGALLLTPLLLARTWKGGKRRLAAFSLLSGIVMGLAAVALNGKTSGQYLVWTFLGAALLFLCLETGLGQIGRLWVEKRSDALDSFFLLSWLVAPLGFSIFFVPFQAARRLDFAIPALVFLAFRSLGSDGSLLEGARSTPAKVNTSVLLLLLLQLTLGVLVNVADYEYAATYRNFADDAGRNWTSTHFDTWFVGHWGWQFYARKAGFRQLHRPGPYPREGDLLLWPRGVHIGRVFEGNEIAARLEKAAVIESPSRLPLVTVNSRGSGFYAVVRNALPFRFQTPPRQRLEIYRVGPPAEKSS
ncbi:MAG: ArnT family glycosyltransferase [Acidobacteriota bacterium]